MLLLLDCVLHRRRSFSQECNDTAPFSLFFPRKCTRRHPCPSVRRHSLSIHPRSREVRGCVHEARTNSRFPVNYLCARATDMHEIILLFFFFCLSLSLPALFFFLLIFSAKRYRSRSTRLVDNSVTS